MDKIHSEQYQERLDGKVEQDEDTTKVQMDMLLDAVHATAVKSDIERCKLLSLASWALSQVARLT